ncbi:hypothetical protein GGE65_006584 [Skermanella aerolata]|uniref:hypothetical protein n=1 Tax=Skermanella aerolata TaxID=393310 RepID=UPI003D1F55DF
MNKYFFQETNDFHDEIISLHDFVLPAATALWNFRQTIGDEIKNNSKVTATELAAKYNTAPTTRVSTNLITPFRDHTWDQQRERLAEVALVNVIALFEIWCDELAELFGRKELAIKLQFPTGPHNTDGVGFALSELAAVKSPAIANSIYSSLSRTKKYSLSKLDNLLKCFRYFKELRNCYMHRGRKCDNRLFGWQSQFVVVANEASLGMDFIPEHKIYKIGDDVSLSLHGVLGFTEVLLRIATTVDAELSATPVGEKVLVERISKTASTPLMRERLPNLFTTMGWQGVPLTTELLTVLKAAAIIR